MPALTINGVTIEISADSFREETVESGDIFARSTANQMFSDMGMVKRRWSFRTRQMESLKAAKLRMFMEGNAQVWPFFSVPPISGAGVGANGAGVWSSTTGFHGDGLLIGSASSFGVALANKLNVPNGWDATKGWTIGFWSYRTVVADGVPADGWYFYLASGAITYIRASAANPVGVTQYRNGVAGSFSLGSVIGVGTTTSISGYTLNNVATAAYYDDLFVLPFEIPAEWATMLYAFALTTPIAPAPLMVANGDHLDNVATNVFIRVTATSHVNATIAGVSKPNVKMMEVTMEEF